MAKIVADQNPLGMDAKREKQGGSTFSKYRYQYHWAFCRILDEHGEGNQYALFVEEHEDVTIASSLDQSLAKFEFNQIKETSTKHNVTSLTKIGKKEKNSILGKLALSVTGKSFSDKVSQVNFVSTGGFNFDLHKKGLSFEVIKSGDCEGHEVEKIRECIKTEAGDDSILSNLAFVIPDLPATSFELVVKGKIGDLIHKIAPGCKYNANNIYDCVIGELYRKGENSFDYQNWSSALKKKAVTSEQIHDLINQHTSRKADEVITFQLTQILEKDYSLPFLKQKNIVNAFHRYYTKRLSDRTPELATVSESIRMIKDKHIDECNDVMELEEIVRKELDSKSMNYFDNSESFTAAFLYEFLVD